MTVFQRPILSDSNVWISAFTNKPSYLKDIRTVAAKGYSIIVSNHVFNEVSRKIPSGREKIMDFLFNVKCPEIKILRDQNEIIQSAEDIETRFSFCHFPDNRLLASAKINTAVLVTSDRDLLRAADFEGVMACTPKNFVRFATVN